MELIGAILAAFSTAAGAAGGTVTVGRWLVSYLRARTRERRTAEVLKFLYDLGCVREAEVQELVKNWRPTTPVDPAVRTELTLLLTNLVRGARFHTTQGTPLSSYLRCERLIEQLLANLEPKRRAGESVGPGRRDWKLEQFVGMGRVRRSLGRPQPALPAPSGVQVLHHGRLQGLARAAKARPSTTSRRSSTTIPT